MVQDLQSRHLSPPSRGEALSPRPHSRPPRQEPQQSPRGSCLTREGRTRLSHVRGQHPAAPGVGGPHPAPKAPRASPHPLSPHEARERGRGGACQQGGTAHLGQGPSGRGLGFSKGGRLVGGRGWQRGLQPPSAPPPAPRPPPRPQAAAPQPTPHTPVARTHTCLHASR